MTEINVELWTSEDNFQDCGEVGVSAIVHFETRCPTTSAKRLGDWAERNIKAPQDKVLVEQDATLLRIHVVPHDEDSIEDPEDWGKDNKYIPMLRQKLWAWGQDRGYTVTFEGEN